MPYPDNFSSAAYDAAQGRGDEFDHEPHDCYEAARKFLYALDRDWLRLDNPLSIYITVLRTAVTEEAARRVADEADAREAGKRILAMARR